MNCIAICFLTEKPCENGADYPLQLKDGSTIPLCWQHAQMIKSGWYMAIPNDSYGSEKLEYYKTHLHGL